ncbi:MAG: heme exporter protein CcmD [Pseudomonadota bacterium]|nr:heme exporter protein CcmD [Pseudomonadota bacterium]
MKSGLSEFLAMGGYGFYVWTSYITAAIAVTAEVLAVRARVRASLKSSVGSRRAISIPDDTQ